jgi:hypothetical protein
VKEIAMSNFAQADIKPMNFGRELELAKLVDSGDALHFVASPFRKWMLIYSACMVSALGWIRYLIWNKDQIRFWLLWFYLLYAAALIGIFAYRYVVSISATELRIRTSILGLGWTRTFPLAEVSNLRFAPIRVSPRRYGLVFERDAQTRRLPIIILGFDASRIKCMFEGRLPQLGLIARSLAQ